MEKQTTSLEVELKPQTARQRQRYNEELNALFFRTRCALAGHTLCFDVYSFDISEEQTFIFAENTPTGSSFIQDNAFHQNGTFCWNTSESDIGFHTFDVLVEDDNVCYTGESTQQFNIKVVCDHCPLVVRYEKRAPDGIFPEVIPLPEETVAGHQIIAGFDVDDAQENGLVICGDEDVTFRAPEIHLDIGFQGGVGFTAIPDPNTCIDDCDFDCCADWDGFTIDPFQNFFTPNGDGEHDVWHVTDIMNPYCAYGATGYNLKIFNRWGNLVFENDDGLTDCCKYQSWAPNNQIDHSAIFWDGTIQQNDPSNDGFYTFVLTLTGCGHEEEFNDSFILISSSNAPLATDEEIEELVVEDKDDSVMNLSDLSEDHPLSKIKVYPNPSNGPVTISGLTAFSSVVLFSINGELVFEKTVYDENSDINIGNLSSGSYVLNIYHQDSVLKEVIVKQ